MAEALCNLEMKVSQPS